MLQMILYSAIAVFLYMTTIFLTAILKKDNSIVDIAWGIGFILVAFLTLFLNGNIVARKILVTAFVTIWGIRLSLHIFLRNKGKKEDFRYANWREEWGKYVVIRSFFQVFMLQGLVLLVVAYPIILINSSSQTGLNYLDFIGIGVWLFGFLFEAIGDYQLSKFKKTATKGEVMTSGLWRYTRHPNYFGEAVVWWGIFFIALSLPKGWTTIISPLLINFLLIRVSGVPMLEEKYKNNEQFREYAEKTSAFVPLPPKK